jgi:hypothetical protein
MLHEVEPIDDLDGLRRPLPNPLSIETTAIAADHRDTGVRLQPRRDRGGRALGEQIHHLMAFEIADHDPEPSASPPGPCIEPDHPWGRAGGKGAPWAKAGEVRQQSVSRQNTTPRSLQLVTRTSFPSIPLPLFHNPPSSTFIENGADPENFGEVCTVMNESTRLPRASWL